MDARWTSPSPAQPAERPGGRSARATPAATPASRSSPGVHSIDAGNWGVTLKADVADDDPRVDSWVPIYAGADWHEREAWEMFGIAFDGHPDLRHLYLPTELRGPSRCARTSRCSPAG